MKKNEIKAGERYAIQHAARTYGTPREALVVDSGTFAYTKVFSGKGYTRQILPHTGKTRRWMGDVVGVLAAEERAENVRDDDGNVIHYDTRAEALAAVPTGLPASAVSVDESWHRKLGEERESWVITVRTWQPIVIPRSEIRMTWADYVVQRDAKDAAERAERQRKTEQVRDYEAWFRDEAHPAIQALSANGVLALPAEAHRFAPVPPKELVLKVTVEQAQRIAAALEAAS